jgi:hypothetical protein
MERAGMRWPGGEAAVGLGMEALKGVWASKFNDRAYYSLRKVPPTEKTYYTNIDTATDI